MKKSRTRNIPSCFRLTAPGALVIVLALGACGDDDDILEPRPPAADNGNGNGEEEQETPVPESEFWDDDTEATQRAQALLDQMTLVQKVDMMHGEFNPNYGFFNAPITEIGIPPMTMADGPVGVRVANPEANEQQATLMPAPIALGATWDRELAREYGTLIGAEADLTGHNVLLAPVVDIIRVPQWGRAFETYSEDPLLTGVLGAESVLGIQSNPVVAALKHYLAYAQETRRLLESNVVVDERTLQEIYVRPFAIVQRDGRPGAVMCGFNQINGDFACENEFILGEILRGQLDFAGWVLSDFGATFSSLPSLEAGLDQEMPGNTGGALPIPCYYCEPLLEAVQNGTVSEDRIDESVLRILRPWIALGGFDNPPEPEPLPEEEHGDLARTIAEQAVVLLKNDDLLPFGDDITSIAVFGADADNVVAGGGSALVIPTYTVSPLEAIRARAGEGVDVRYHPGNDPLTSAALLPGPEPIPSGFLRAPDGEHGLRAQYFLNQEFSGEPELDRTDPYAAINGGFFLFEGFTVASPAFPELPQTLNGDLSIRWTGELTVPADGVYEFVLVSRGTGRLFLDGEPVVETAPGDPDEIVETRAEVPLEQGDTVDLRVEYVNDARTEDRDVGPQFKLSWMPPTRVISPRSTEAARLAAESDVAVIVVRDYSSEGGDRTSLRLPFGQEELIQEVAEANPQTVVVTTTGGAVNSAAWDDAVPAILQAWYGGQEQGNAIARVLFGDVNPSGRLPISVPMDEESTPVGIPERFPGAGTNQVFSETIFVGYRGHAEFDLEPRYAFGHGLSYTEFRYDGLRVSRTPAGMEEQYPLQVTVTVQNTGRVAGTETVQVYVGNLPADVPTAPIALAGFERVTLDPGERRAVTVNLERNSLSYWDTVSDRWVTPAGDVPILVGSSSADIRLRGTGTLPQQEGEE